MAYNHKLYINIYIHDIPKNYCRKYKLRNLEGCFTFYRDSALNTFQKTEAELRTLHRFFPSSSLHTYTLLFLALCLSIYNLLLLHIHILKMLLYEDTNLTLKSVITIYLETYIKKFNSTFLYMRDVNSSFYRIV